MNRFARVLCVVLVFWSGLCFAQAKPQPAPAPVAAPSAPTTVTISGPLALQLAPAIDPQSLKRLEELSTKMDGRLGRLEKGQVETNKKVDILLKKVDQLLSQKSSLPQKKEVKAAVDPVEAEKKKAKEEGFVRHTCGDGKEYCFWRPRRCDPIQIWDWSMETWCRIERFSSNGVDGWYVLRGNMYRFFLPAAEIGPIMAKISWID